MYMSHRGIDALGGKELDVHIHPRYQIRMEC